MSKSWSSGSERGWRKQRQRILRRDCNQCQQCGETEGQMHIDHIIPKRLVGKETSDDNLRVLCAQCNLRKGGFFDMSSTLMSIQGEKTPKNASVSHE